MNDCEVANNIELLIKDILPEVLAKGLEKAAQLIENESKRNCPVDDGVLRASITHEVDVDNSQAFIGSNVEYAPYVHDGTGLYAKNGNGKKTSWKYTTADGQTYISHGQKPKPFIQDAIDSNLDNIPTLFENLL